MFIVKRMFSRYSARPDSNYFSLAPPSDAPFGVRIAAIRGKGLFYDHRHYRVMLFLSNALTEFFFLFVRPIPKLLLIWRKIL